jgi:hypothetical protein
MNSSMNRWIVSGTWLAAVFALISASTKGAIGVGAMWSLPAALAVTMGSMGWPDKPFTRVLAAIGLVWQVALIGAYWPFAAAETDPTKVNSPLHWSTHSIVILVVLALLTMSFVALYVLPALGLTGRIKRAARIVFAIPEEAAEKIPVAFAKDEALLGLWNEYLGQLRGGESESDAAPVSSSASARDLFDPMTVSHSRLRLDFFRNLPGVFTGIGIIGTFSGLITGLRAFQISQDPAVVQRSLESLLSGVWGAFLISAVAIALAIVVTVVEKIVSSALSHHLELLAGGLDKLYPPRPQAESEAWVPRLVEALHTLNQRNATAPVAPPLPAPAASAGAALPMAAAQPMVPMSMEPMSTLPASPLAVSAGSSPELTSQMLEVAQTTRSATLALGEMAARLPDMLAHTLQGSTQNHQQASQAMKTLAARLETVASGIEFSARKTLETVAARLMQSEMNMVSRHHAVADHLGELVQRIEALCGLLQQDRADLTRGAAADPYGREASGFDDPSHGGGYAPGYGGRDDSSAYRQMPGGRGFAPNNNPYASARQPAVEPNGYGGMQGEDLWQDLPPDAGGFGR